MGNHNYVFAHLGARSVSVKLLANFGLCYICLYLEIDYKKNIYVSMNINYKFDEETKSKRVTCQVCTGPRVRRDGSHTSGSKLKISEQ